VNVRPDTSTVTLVPRPQGCIIAPVSYWRLQTMAAAETRCVPALAALALAPSVPFLREG
jgi:hypothetical protein